MHSDLNLVRHVLNIYGVDPLASTVLSSCGAVAAMADILFGFWVHRNDKYRPLLRGFPP